jgi:hypothetical protein
MPHNSAPALTAGNPTAKETGRRTWLMAAKADAELLYPIIAYFIAYFTAFETLLLSTLHAGVHEFRTRAS